MPSSHAGVDVEFVRVFMCAMIARKNELAVVLSELSTEHGSVVIKLLLNCRFVFYCLYISD